MAVPFQFYTSIMYRSFYFPTMVLNESLIRAGLLIHVDSGPSTG